MIGPKTEQLQSLKTVAKFVVSYHHHPRSPPCPFHYSPWILLPFLSFPFVSPSYHFTFSLLLNMSDLSEPTPEPVQQQPPPPEPTPEPFKPENEPEINTKTPVEPVITEEKGRSFIQPATSFKVESNLLTDLTETQHKSLNDLKTLLKSDLNDENPSIWGIPLLQDERTDVILLKFLRARDFNPLNSLQMLKTTLKWRQEFDIDNLLEEDLGDDLEKVVFMHGNDREGHPVCYNVYGEFQNKELYGKTFLSEEKRRVFLKWRVLFLEKSIRKLDYGYGGVNTIFQINDLKNAPGPGKRDLRIATRDALNLLQDNFPEFVAKQVSISIFNCLL